MQLHRKEIASKIIPFRFFVSIKAAWHGANALKIPRNVSFLQLPPWWKPLALPLYCLINFAHGPNSSSIKRALRTQQPKTLARHTGQRAFNSRFEIRRSVLPSAS
jgi:hypothetical protein